MEYELGPWIQTNSSTTYTRASAADECVRLNLRYPLRYFARPAFDRYGEIIFNNPDTRHQILFSINRSCEYDDVLPDDPESWTDEHHRLARLMYWDALCDLDNPSLVQFGCEIEEVDVDEDSDQPTHTFRRIYNAPLRFTGERIAYTESQPSQTFPELFSGAVGHWTELSLYLTIGGNYVCLKRHYSQWDGDVNTQYVRFFTDKADVAAYVAYDALAASFCRQAGLTFVAPAGI